MAKKAKKKVVSPKRSEPGAKKVPGAAKKKTGGVRPKAKAASKGKTRAKSGKSGHDELFEHVRRDFEAAREAVASEFHRAVDRARQRVDESGLVDKVRIERAQKELAEQMRAVRQRVKEAGEDVAERIQSDERIRAAADSGIAGLHGLVGSLRGLAERVEAALDDVRSYPAGESVAAASYSCRECGETTVLAEPGVLPSCGGCGGRAFKRLPARR